MKVFDRYEKNQGMNWIRKEKRLAIYMRDGGRCAYCESTEQLTLDHLRHSGSNDATNLVTACFSCNSSKQETPLSQFCTDETVIRRIKELVARPVDKKAAVALLARRNWKKAVASLRA